MTFLELCQRVVMEAGLSGSGPESVTSQTGEMAEVVTWVQQAYTDIQNARPDWLFMREDFSFQTISGTQSYTTATIGLADFGRWVEDGMSIYLTSTGSAGEQYLCPLSWPAFKAHYLFGSERTQTGFPMHVSVMPDKSLALGQIPNGIYTVLGEYYKEPESLSGNSDEPLLPAQFHMAIVWRAVMHAAVKKAAIEKYDHGKNEYRRLMNEMEFDQLLPVELAGPMV